ncbi:hypothetical protein DFH09DRAFT_1182014 [Mycena vulgaris]|nr:hypothetical protein DFH09DRAFT_1182014 [Mycena vulgaris]
MPGRDSPAHLFICIHELYELLLMQLSQGGGYALDQTSIARLARVSKMTSDPALDVLWMKVTRPSQIIHLLPEETYELIKLPYSSGQYNLGKRVLMESDFATFDKYAPRVQLVNLSSSFTSVTGGCELFSTLKTFRDPIFPRLLGLDWHPSVKFNTVGAFHLISREFNVPKDHFALSMWSRVNVSDAVVKKSPNFATGVGLAETIALFQKPLSSWLPDVPSLSMHTGSVLPNPVILEGLRSLSDLQHFDSQLSLGADTLAHLAGLPRLKTLHIWEEVDPTMASLSKIIVKRQQSNGPPSFPALESVEIRGTYSTLNTFLPFLTSNVLESVVLNLTDFQPVDTSIFSILTTPSTRLSTLRHFTFHTPDYAIPERKRHALFSIAMFEPLFACANLETFDVKFDAFKVEFDDAGLERMADAWPRLACLKVFSRYTQQYTWADPQVQLYTLWSLVEKCRGLRQIEMAIDARVDYPFVPPQGRAVSGLYTTHKICFFLLPCGSPTYVAAFLNLAFPQLADFHAGAPKERTENRIDHWGQVRDALPGVDQEWRAMRLAFANVRSFAPLS